MESLVITLSNLTKRVTEIKKSEDRKKNAKAIVEVNNRFTLCIQNIKSASDFIEYSRHAFDYQPSHVLLAQIRDSIEIAKKMIVDDNITNDSVLSLEEKNKKWNGSNGTLQKEWRAKYASLYASINGLISIVGITDPQLISRCKPIIDSAATYSLDLNKFISFKKAIEEINGLIKILDIDDEIKAFLIKVAKETALVSDINEKILKWIYMRGLATKMKVSFKSSK